MSQYTNERGIRHGANMNPAGGGTYGESPTSGPAPTTAGHHKHDILNKLDPRVDSTQDRQPVPPQGANNNIPAGTYGPHHSRLANALDPRVDSDMDHRGAAAAQPAMHGGSAPEGTYGPHSSRVANAMDPRVDSDADNRGHYPTSAAAAGAAAPGYGPGMGAAMSGAPAGIGYRHHQQPVRGTAPMAGTGAGAGAGMYNNASSTLPGPASNTTGPHRSNLLNKLDPRVDSKTGERRDERPYTEGGYTERKGI